MGNQRQKREILYTDTLDNDKINLRLLTSVSVHRAPMGHYLLTTKVMKNELAPEKQRKERK